MKENIKKGLIILLIVTVFVIAIKMIYSYYNKEITKEQFAEQASPSTSKSVISPAVNNPINTVLSNSGPYIQKNSDDKEEDDFPELTSEQQKCITKFTKECLSNLSPSQTEVYNSLVSAPSEENINQQSAYNTAVVSPK